MLYEKHPQYKPVFIAAMVLVVINALYFMWWAWRWQSRRSVPQKSSRVLGKPD
jgi:hypothetical protein